ncbi:MAG: hypothetical protein KAW92_10685 [Candidatus Cloacimonetes bacterium]|nr:hypothetical protein [Candidatus Cloacimonadota bacterium]
MTESIKIIMILVVMGIGLCTFICPFIRTKKYKRELLREYTLGFRGTWEKDKKRIK